MSLSALLCLRSRYFLLFAFCTKLYTPRTTRAPAPYNKANLCCGSCAKLRIAATTRSKNGCIFVLPPIGVFSYQSEVHSRIWTARIITLRLAVEILM